MATIQERLERLGQLGERAETASIQQRLDRLGQMGVQNELARSREDGASSVPSVPGGGVSGQGTAVQPPRLGHALVSMPGGRTPRVIQGELDIFDSGIRSLRKVQDRLNGQAQQLISRAQSGRGGGEQYRQQWMEQAKALRSQAEELEGQISGLESGRAGLQREWNQSDQQQWTYRQTTPEFKAAVDKAMGSPYGFVTATSRKPSHRDVGSAMTYFQAKAKGDEALAAAAKSSADMALDLMSEGQRDRLAYYVGMGDYDGAADYLNRIAPALNQAQMDKTSQGLAEWGKEHPIQGAAVNIVSWPMNIPAYFANAKQAAKNLVTGEQEQDPHLAAYGAATIGTSAGQGVQGAARDAAKDTFGSEFAGDAAAFLAGTGLSIGQNATQIAALGPLSLAGMSMSAAGSSTAEALDRGATPGQAFALGTASGLTEAATEKLPLDNLFRLAKEGGGKGLKAAAIDMLKQMGTEATEEAISEVAGNLADAIVMGDKSELNAYVRELQAAGMSKEDAERAAIWRFYAVNTGLAALGGGISGGVMGGGALALGQMKGRGAQETGVEQGLALDASDGGPHPSSGGTAAAYESQALTANEAGEAAREAQMAAGKDLAAQLEETERLFRDAYESGDLNEAGYRAGLERIQEARMAVEGSTAAFEAARRAGGTTTLQAEQEGPQAVQRAAEAQERATPTETSAEQTSRRKEIAAEARTLRQDYAQRKIDDAAFDRAMDGLQTEAELTGMEASEAQKLLDGTVATMTKGETDYETGTAAGEQLSGGDGGRLPGTGAGGENGSMAEGGPQGPADAGGTAVQRTALGQSLQLEAVSSRELGLINGTDARTVRVLPEDAWDGELRSIARQVRQETGLSVRFTLGPMEAVGSGGQTCQVRGAFNENGIFVQADNRSAAVEQIADHEIFHSYAQADPELVRAVEEAIVDRFSREELDQMADQYIMALRGIVDAAQLDEMDGAAYAQALAEAKNELLADAFAGINAFGTQAANYQETVYETLEDRGTVRPQRGENAQAMDKRGSPSEVRFSLDELPNGQRFVNLDTDQTLFDGLSDREKTDLAIKLIRERFAGRTIGRDNPAFVNSTSAREYGHPVKNIDSEIRDAKMRAAPELDNLMDAGFNHRIGQDGQDGHVHPRATGGFEYYDVIFKIGDEYFQGVINLEVNNRGRRLKDVTKIRNITQDIYGSYGQSPKSVFLSDASEESIAQSDSPVKPWDGTLPRATDGERILPGGQERYSTQEEVPDGLTLPTFAQVQEKREQGGGDQAPSLQGGPHPSSGGTAPAASLTGPASAATSSAATATMDALPAKARDYLQRAERRLTGKIGELLSVPKSARREFLQDIVRDMSVEYLSTGQVSQETRNELFERAYEQGVQVDREYYDNYKHVRDYLRSTPITVSEKVKGDITDYGAWRKGAFGTMRLVKDGGVGVDTAYMELQDMAPGLFPNDITHPADQLRHILETAKGIRTAEQNLDEFYGPDAAEFKRLTRRGFDETVADLVGELRQVKRYTDERTMSKEPPQVPTTPQEAAELYRRKKGAQRVYQRAESRNLLTEHDQVQVGRLLRGELELSHLDPAKDNVRGITAVYEAKQEYEQLAKTIREWNSQRKAQLRAEADGFLETANQWKDKAAGILYSRETMERNIRDIVPDQDLADRINKHYFQPVHQAAAEANKTKNQYRDRVRDLKLSRKKAAGNEVSEAYAVQLLGEAEDNIRRLEESQGRKKEVDGKTLQEWQAVVAELWEKSPNLDQDKIRGAVKEFRAIYDELFQQMNEARVRNGYEPVSYRQGYFPHFQADSEGLMAQFGRALGIDTAVTNLPTTINGLTHTFKPGIQYFANALERKGFDTAYDAVQGFDRYIEGAADVIHQTDNIQTLRALAAQARYRTGDEGLREQVKRVQDNNELTDQEKQTLIDEIYKDGKFALSNFVVELDEYTNLLANKKSRADRNMEQALGRRMYNIVKGLESRVAANMVAVNPASWLTNFVPLTQGWGSVNTRFMLEGMWDTLKAYKTDDGMVEMSNFLTNRRGSDPIVKTWAQGASNLLSQPMEYIDQFTADTLVRARFRQNQAAGLSEAASIEEADAWAAGLMADRSKGSTPTLFNRSNPLTKVFTQFQLEVNNQLSYLFKDLPRDLKKKGLAALAAGLMKFLVGAYLYNEVYEYFIGRRCALDPIGILNDSVGDFTGYQMPNLVGMAVDAAQGNEISFEAEKKKPFDAVTGLGTNVAEELPFIGGVLGGGRVPISSALPDWENLAKAAVNNEWDGKKRATTAVKALSGPATYLALPFGGGQVKKIYQGLKTVHEGGSWTVDNEGNDILQYPVFNETAEDKLLTLPTALTFGKSSLPTAREWAERGFKSMSAKQTACYQGMTELGVPQRDAYQLLQELGDVEDPKGEDTPATEKAAYQKRKLLQEADISDQGKGVVYYTLMASDTERELMNSLSESGADMGEAARVLMELKDAGAEYKSSEASAVKKNAIVSSSLSEEEKDAIFGYVLGKDSTGAAWSTEFAKAGLGKYSAAAAANALNALTPEEGHKTVSDAQKWRAVLDAAGGERNQKAALLVVMSDSARMRYEIADQYGIKAEAWVQVKEMLPQFDENKNGSYSSKEIEKAIDALAGDGYLLAPWDKDPIRLSREEKAVLWQLFTGSASGNGNPYSTRVGKQVAKELERAREEAKE